ncbi:protein aurora borealis [Culicoides brevitarsis]|uniref:protein aurora borealis n=1 Tax=Culicoides brevitarsis TaxID=469753 RepID=UPI00307C58E5
MEHESYKTPIKVFTSPRIRTLQQTSSLQKKNRHKYHLIPIIHTSSANSPSCGSRFPKIVNPFEQHLADRLHLPVICSPSLFHRPATPQHSSTQFEWTIDDVSSLAPANVEVSDQQFQQCHDPELEERAQAAINSYFKENEIVPSPIECPLRNQKIVLRNESSVFLSDSSADKKRKNVRNGCAQTVLSFPPNLPKEIEDLLAPFCTFTQDQQQSLSPQDCDTTIDHEARDASLRRKLFDVPFGACAANTEDSSLHDSLHDIDLQALSPPPKTPEIDIKQIKQRTRNFGTPLNARNLQFHEKSPNISISPVKKDTFGSLSPISKISPPLTTKPQIVISSSSEDKENLYRSNNSSDSSLYRSTPEKSRSTLVLSPAEMSIDRSVRHLSTTKHIAEMSIDQGTESNAPWDLSDDTKSKTPVRRRPRIASKNLSLSFSLYAGDNNLMDENEEDAVLSEVVGLKESTTPSFYRTDSGFTETSTMNDSLKHFDVARGTHFTLMRDENSMDISMRSDF